MPRHSANERSSRSGIIGQICDVKTLVTLRVAKDRGQAPPAAGAT